MCFLRYPAFAPPNEIRGIVLICNTPYIKKEVCVSPFDKLTESDVVLIWYSRKTRSSEVQKFR